MKDTVRPKRAGPGKVRTGSQGARHTANIELIGVGVSEDDERYLKVKVEQKTAMLNVDNISDTRSGELKILTRLGEPLIKPQARAEFLNRVHDAAREEPTFKVAAKTGWRDGVFVLPLGLAPEGEINIERYFNAEFARYHRRLRQEGSLEGWQELAKKCRGKTRLIAGFCLQFAGPVCGALGYEPPSLQLVYRGGFGMTTIGRVTSTVWGGDPTLSRKIGCGVSWNNTTGKLEVVAAAFNQMCLYLDDMHNAGEGEIKAVFNIMNGEGRGRLKELQESTFSLSIFSTSNTSIVKIAKRLKLDDEMEALIDRLPEISRPVGCRYFFEGIRTPAEFRDYGNYIRNLACKNFGWAGPEFLQHFEFRLQTTRRSVEAFGRKRQEAYFEASKHIASAGDRDVTRVGNRFATLYVSGCLASRYKILPFTEPEILEALLACHRDHVAFIDQELAVASGRPPARAPSAQPTPESKGIDGARKPTEGRYSRFRRIFYASKESGFLDFRKLGARVSSKAPAVGYKFERGHGDSRRTEYLIVDSKFEAMAGGPDEATALKRELHERGLIETNGKGKKLRYTIKRSLPDGSRPYFVVMRDKPKLVG